MVAGRLNREVNPTPGEKPGFTPQHKKLDGTYVDTGEEFNLPTNDAATQAKLDSSIAELQNLKTELQAQKAQLQGIIDGTSPANTKLTGSKAEEVFSYEEQGTSTNGLSFDVSRTKYIAIDVTKCNGSGSSITELRVEVSNDETHWKEIPTFLESTGHYCNVITHEGVFWAEVIGWSFARVPAKFVGTDLTGRTINASVRALNEKPELITDMPTSKNLVPDIHSITTEMITSSSTTSWCSMDDNDVLYGLTGPHVRKTSDWSQTWEQIHQFPGTMTPIVEQVIPLETGSLLVALENRDLDVGEVWISDETQSTWTKTLEMASHSNSISGIDVYKNIVIVSEYLPYPARNVYISYDYGVTFTTLFTGIDNPDIHIHDVRYDPYDSIIWIATGDSIEASNIHWSVDWGKTWNQAFETGKAPMLFMQIMPMPNCVLFGSDDRRVSVYRWNRPTQGIQSSSKIVIELAKILNEEWETSRVPMVSKALLPYGNNPIYFGFTLENDTDMRAQIWATHDGFNFYQIWSAPTPIDSNTNGTAGINSVFGVSSDGYIGAWYRNLKNGTTAQLLKIKEPDWK